MFFNTNSCVRNHYPMIADIVIPKLQVKLEEYKVKLELISSDLVVNSKIDRFKTLTEMFLQEYLSIIITNYLDFKD